MYGTTSKNSRAGSEGNFASRKTPCRREVGDYRAQNRQQVDRILDYRGRRRNNASDHGGLARRLRSCGGSMNRRKQCAANGTTEVARDSGDMGDRRAGSGGEGEAPGRLFPSGSNHQGPAHPPSPSPDGHRTGPGKLHQRICGPQCAGTAGMSALSATWPASASRSNRHTWSTTTWR